MLVSFSPALPAAALLVGMALVYLMLDQFYGNYSMVVGTCLMLGMTAGMQSNFAWKDGLVAGHAK